MVAWGCLGQEQGVTANEPEIQSQQPAADEAESLLDGDAPAFAVSFFVHLAAIVSLGLIPMATPKDEVLLVVQAAAHDKAELTLPQEFTFRDEPSMEVGSSSVQGELAALSLAPVISEVSNVPNILEAVPVDTGRIEINNILERATGLRYAENLAVKGVAGEGTTGAEGAIDRITHEILLSLEERKTLVVWLFDSTASLVPQRKAIRDRFNRIYDELGIIQASRGDTSIKTEDKPLLSSVVGFGNSLVFMTEKPTDELTELKRAVMAIPDDESGTENVFSAVFEVAKRYASFRHTASEQSQPERNVMIVVFTDEAGTDTNRAEETIKMCRRWAMPVYVIGVPAPFGRKETYVKWVDPDPKYDQSPQRAAIDQGPESLLPERIKLSFSSSGLDEEPIDSGFGPYALTRLCFETGGIYFAVHPNRNVNRRVNWQETADYSGFLAHFFDPDVMRQYRPEYVSVGEYQKRKEQNKARAALIEAASRSLQVGAIERAARRFVKTDEAEFSRQLSTAQQAAASLEPKINELYAILQRGEADREKETVLRWQAGFDLAMGRVLAAKIRTESYNAMLAAAKRGLKPSDPKNNIWEIRSSDEITVGSNYVKLAERAKMYLTRVVSEHPGTPWAMLAKRELDDPLGWTWKDSYTPQETKKAEAKVVNNAKAVSRPTPKTMLAKPLPKRPPPKL
jgi:hypothetical protein